MLPENNTPSDGTILVDFDYNNNNNNNNINRTCARPPSDIDITVVKYYDLNIISVWILRGDSEPGQREHP